MTTDVPPSPAEPETEKKKKRDKTRDVWISFAGRIVAQVIGATASVFLGIYAVQQYQKPAAPAPDSTAAAAPAAIRVTSRRAGEPAIAVLPFANMSGRADQEYFADGMTEAITADLAKVGGLTVISRTSAMRYKASDASITDIARALDVDLVVEGSVMQAGDQVRVTAQLIDTAADAHLWAESYNRRVHDVIALQGDVAQAIATAIKGTVARLPRTAAVPANLAPEVYDQYLRGRHAWYRRTAEGLDQAIEFFSRAAAAAPDFALAHVGLADAHVLKASPSAGLRDVQQHMASARRSAIRALDLDPDLAEAHTALGSVLFFGERDFRGAELAFTRAIELNPNYAVAHEYLAVLLAELGRDREALDHAERAITLDPLEGTMYQGRASVHYLAKRYPEAIDSARRGLELSPGMPLATALVVKASMLGGNVAGAVTRCREELAAGRAGIDLEWTCKAVATRAGDRELASRLTVALDRRGAAKEVAKAQLAAATGDLSTAFPALERLAAADNLPPALAFDPIFEPLRHDPRWRPLAERLRSRTDDRGRGPSPAR